MDIPVPKATMNDKMTSEQVLGIDDGMMIHYSIHVLLSSCYLPVRMARTCSEVEGMIALAAMCRKNQGYGPLK